MQAMHPEIWSKNPTNQESLAVKREFAIYAPRIPAESIVIAKIAEIEYEFESFSKNDFKSKKIKLILIKITAPNSAAWTKKRNGYLL